MKIKKENKNNIEFGDFIYSGDSDMTYHIINIDGKYALISMELSACLSIKDTVQELVDSMFDKYASLTVIPSEDVMITLLSSNW